MLLLLLVVLLCRWILPPLFRSSYRQHCIFIILLSGLGFLSSLSIISPRGAVQYWRYQLVAQLGASFSTLCCWDHPLLVEIMRCPYSFIFVFIHHQRHASDILHLVCWCPFLHKLHYFENRWPESDHPKEFWKINPSRKKS